MSYAYEQWLFHYLAHEDKAYLAVADTEMGRRVPFVFLERLQAACAAGDEPGAALARLRHEANEAPAEDPIHRAHAELGSAKEVLTRNVEQILNRGEQIELLMDRTDSAAHQSLAFRRRAVALRREMWWRNTKVLALVGVCCVVRTSRLTPGTVDLFVPRVGRLAGRGRGGGPPATP